MKRRWVLDYPHRDRDDRWHGIFRMTRRTAEGKWDDRRDEFVREGGPREDRTTRREATQ